MLYLCLLIVIIYILIWRHFDKNNDYWKKRNIPQMNGTTWKFIVENRSLSEVYKYIYEQYPNEPQVGIFIGTRPALLVRNLENIQSVFSTDFKSFHSRGIITNENDTLADNLLFMNDYKKWKIVRQRLSPVFTSAKLKDMFFIIEQCARDFVEFVEDNQNMREHPFAALYTYTTASIGASVFGIDTQNRNTMESPFLDMTWKVMKPTFLGNMKFIIANTMPWLFRYLKIKLFGEHEQFFIEIVKNVLQSRLLDFTPRHDFIDICLNLKRCRTMYDLLASYELAVTDELLAAQAFFFFLAGTDTSANTMHFTLLELSNNPHILSKVHAEIDNVFKQCKETLTFKDFEKLTYLEMVICETMRKFPNIGAIQRKCTASTILPVGKVKVEKDELIIIPVFGIHRDKKYYPDPDVFNPERFAPENISKIPRYSYLPFGEGNRICIGSRFAKIQVKMGLAWLLRRFTLREQSYYPEKFEPSSFSISKVNLHYELIPRDNDEI